MSIFRKRFAFFEGESGDGGAPAGGADAAAPAGDGGTPEGASAKPITNTGDSPVAWLQAIEDADLRTYAEGKGFKSAGEACAALRDVESKYAAPEKPEGYELGDGDFAKTAATWFHENGVPAATAKALAGKWDAYVQEQNTAAETARQQAGERELAALKTEWGGDYDKNIELGRQAMRKFGISGEVIDRLSSTTGDAQTIKVFSQIGAALSEGVLNPGGDGGGSGAALTPEQRAAKFYSNTKQ